VERDVDFDRLIERARLADEAREVTARIPRRCAMPGCLTLLSRYNTETLCGVHAQVRFPRRTD
jgi:hypothetical protein